MCFLCSLLPSSTETTHLRSGHQQLRHLITPATSQPPPHSPPCRVTVSSIPAAAQAAATSHVPLLFLPVHRCGSSSCAIPMQAGLPCAAGPSRLQQIPDVLPSMINSFPGRPMLFSYIDHAVAACGFLRSRVGCLVPCASHGMVLTHGMARKKNVNTRFTTCPRDTLAPLPQQCWAPS